MLNETVLMGRIAREMELKKAANGNAYVQFVLACQESEEHTNFIPCIAWGKQAENIVKYVVKGCRVLVRGSISVRTKKMDDASYRTFIQVRARNVQFVDYRKENEQVQSREYTPQEMVNEPNLTEETLSMDTMAFDMNDSMQEDQSEALRIFMQETDAIIDDSMLPF